MRQTLSSLGDADVHQSLADLAPSADAGSGTTLVEANGPARTSQIVQMQKILAEDLPNIPIALTGYPIAMKSDIQGYTWFPENFLHCVWMRRSA